MTTILRTYKQFQQTDLTKKNRGAVYDLYFHLGFFAVRVKRSGTAKKPAKIKRPSRAARAQELRTAAGVPCIHFRQINIRMACKNSQFLYQ